MGEVLNIIVAFAVVVLVFRWASGSGGEEDKTAAQLGFRPKKVTEDMVQTITAMFPDIPQHVYPPHISLVDNIHYDLLRTGNISATTNKILERGFLDAPPAPYYTVYPRATTTASLSSSVQPSTSTAPQQPKETLISRYQLQTRLSSDEPVDASEEAGGKAVWEDTAEKREASLRERKAKMILAARQRMLAAKEKQASSLA